MFFVTIVVTSLKVKRFPLAAEIQVVIRKWLLLGVLRPLQVYKMSVSSRYCSINVESFILFGYEECGNTPLDCFHFLELPFV